MDQEMFDKLLDRLDPDREQARAKLVFIYCNLIGFFKKQENLKFPPEEYAIETIMRVAEKIKKTEDETKKIENLSAYIFGVARNVLMESWRGDLRMRKSISLEEILEMKMPSVNPNDEEEERRWWKWKKTQLQCMQECLEEALLPTERKLILEHCQKGMEKVMADWPQMSENALKVRITRIRKKLRACRKGCVQRRMKG